MWPEEMWIGGGQLRQDGEEGRLLSMWNRWECVEHGVHKREGLGLLSQVARREEGDGCAEGREANLKNRTTVTSQSMSKRRFRSGACSAVQRGVFAVDRCF